MADVLLFGATGFTGRLTARALARRSADFAIAGRSRSKLEALAAETGAPSVRVASVGDVDSLCRALEGARVLVTCVGPFTELGDTAVEAALRTKVHYVDSTGEGPFIARLISERARRAEDAGIAMVPAMGFDEVPADVAATLACEGLDRPELILTYAFPSRGSAGTAKSGLHIAAAPGPWIENGDTIQVRAGERWRWAPMPPPLGPRRAASFPVAEAHLAPLHLDLSGLQVYATLGRPQAVALRAAPVLRPALSIPPVHRAVDRLLEVAVRPPEGRARQGKWTVLAEASSGTKRRNAVAMGADPYGLTAELLAHAAAAMADPEFKGTGVLSPVQALGTDDLEKELIDCDVSIEISGG
jgi:short subunit dehydrogenase-like uncharacterized protein